VRMQKNWRSRDIWITLPAIFRAGNACLHLILIRNALNSPHTYLLCSTVSDTKRKK
jgi:hypothetical protein